MLQDIESVDISSPAPLFPSSSLLSHLPSNPQLPSFLYSQGWVVINKFPPKPYQYRSDGDLSQAIERSHWTQTKSSCFPL